MDPKEVEADTHEDFYRFVANAYDKPRFTFHFRTDAPMDVRALLYVPDSRPGEFVSFLFYKILDLSTKFIPSNIFKSLILRSKKQIELFYSAFVTTFYCIQYFYVTNFL